MAAFCGCYDVFSGSKKCQSKAVPLQQGVSNSTDSWKFESQHEVYSNPKFDIDLSFFDLPGGMLFGTLHELI